MNWNKIGSYFLHGAVGILITAAPAVIQQIPDTYTSMTVGAVIAIAFKWVHDAVGY